MKHINRIYEALLNRKEKVCHKSEIVDIIKEYKKKFKSTLSITNTVKYLSRHNYIKRVFRSYYYLNSVDERKRGYCFYEDKELLFIVLNKLQMRWYVGLNSALYLAGKTWQVPRTLHILNNQLSGERKILELNVKFFKIKDLLFVGLKKQKTTHNIPYSYSTLPKTSLDMVYLRESDELRKGKQIKKYLKYYPKWLGKK